MHKALLDNGSSPKQPACNLALAKLTQLHSDVNVQWCLLKTVHMAPCLKRALIGSDEA